MSGIDCLHLPKLPRYPTNHRSDYETTFAILSPPMFLNFSFRYWSCRSIWTLWSHPSHHHLKLTFSGAWHMCQSEKVFQAKLQRHWHLMLVLLVAKPKILDARIFKSWKRNVPPEAMLNVVPYLVPTEKTDRFWCCWLADVELPVTHRDLWKKNVKTQNGIMDCENGKCSSSFSSLDMLENLEIL